MPLALTQDRINTYRENGYLILKNVYDGEFVQAMRTEADALLARAAGRPETQATWPGKWLSEDDRAAMTVHSVHDLQFHAAVFTRMLLHPALIDPVADLIGPNVQLHHTKLHVKPPEKGAPFPLHQDYPYFPHEKHSMLAAVVHLDDATPENGCLRVIPASHKLGPLPVEDDGLYLSPQKYPLDSATEIPAGAGDVLLFNYLTIHGSSINKTTSPRRIIVIQLRAPDDPPTQQVHLSQGQGMILRGHDPNDNSQLH